MRLVKKQNPEARRELMLKGSLMRVIPKLAIPSIISMLITSFYNMADTLFVSSLGKVAVGAVGISFSLDNIISIFGMAVGTGASSYISRLLGAKRDRQAEETLATSFFAALAVGTILGVFSFIFRNPLLRFLGSTDTIIDSSISYSTYLIFAAPFTVSSLILNQSLRAEGSAIFSMCGIVSGAVINCILDPLFIFVFNWGVAGAGAATSISKFISFCILLFPYIRRSSILHLSIKHVRIKKELVIEVGKMGLPIFFRSTLTNFVAVLSNNTAASFGDSAIAAMVICNRAMHFFAAGLMGFGQGYQPVVGFNWGAGQYDRVWKAFWFAIKVGVVVMAVVCTPVFIFAEQFISLFSPEDAEVMRIGLFAVRTQCIAMPIGAIVVVINMTFTALGRAIGSTILGLSRQGICFVPAVIILPRIFGVLGLAGAQAAADVLSVFIGVPLAILILRDVKTRLNELRKETELVKTR